MSWVDILIVIFLASAIMRGLQVGLLQLLFSSAGFLGGLLLGSWLARQLAPHFSGPLAKLFIVLGVEMLLAFLLAFIGELAGFWLSARAMRLKLGKLNQWLGAALEIVFVLSLVWLLASALSNVRSYNIGQAVRQSFIVRQLDSRLPQPPDIFAELEKIISPNGFPNVFLGLEPRHTSVAPTNHVDNQAILNDEKSVVQIRGAGCGGVVFGSGFVVDRGIVVTNAHVVAGILYPQVVDGSGTFKAVIIGFNPDLDVAVLRVSGLNDPSLTLSNQVLPDNDAAAVLGYPGGGPLVAQNAAIIDHVTAEGHNIYNQGVVLRNIYEVQADVEPGNSGGPLLAPDGTVAGVVFAKAVSQNNVGYALLIDQLRSTITQAEQQNSPVSTGSCTQD